MHVYAVTRRRGAPVSSARRTYGQRAPGHRARRTGARFARSGIQFLVAPATLGRSARTRLWPTATAPSTGTFRQHCRCCRHAERTRAADRPRRHACRTTCTVSGEIAVTGWASTTARSRGRHLPFAGGRGRVRTGSCSSAAPSSSAARVPTSPAAFPNMPDNDNAGWGFMLLTNMLPNQGNGIFDSACYRHRLRRPVDAARHAGASCANARRTLPFGTIDTPGQGATVSGTIVNFGWALARAGRVDSDRRQHHRRLHRQRLPRPPGVQQLRADIATLFPGLANTTAAGAVGHFTIDTRHAVERPAHDQLGDPRQPRPGVRRRQPVLPGSELIAKETGAMASSTHESGRLRRAPSRTTGRERVAARRGARCSALARSAPPRARRPRSAARARRGPPPSSRASCGCSARMTNGVTPNDVAWIYSLGYNGYLDWQLNYEPIGDPEADARVAALQTIGVAAVLAVSRSDSALVQRELARSDDHPRDLLEPSAVRADGGVLARSLQHQHRPGRHPQDRSRIARSIRHLALTNVLRRCSSRSAASPAMLVYLEQHAERRPPGTRAEPELRARADGAAHARRQRRLHAAGCHRGRAVLHRLAHATATPAIRRAGSSSTMPAATTTAASWCSACRSRLAAAFNDGFNVLKILAGHPSTAQLRLAQAASLAPRLQPVDDARRRHRRRVHAHQRRHQVAPAPPPVATRTSCGRRRSSSVRSTSSSPRCA